MLYESSYWGDLVFFNESTSKYRKIESCFSFSSRLVVSHDYMFENPVIVEDGLSDLLRKTKFYFCITQKVDLLLVYKNSSYLLKTGKSYGFYSESEFNKSELKSLCYYYT